MPGIYTSKIIDVLYIYICMCVYTCIYIYIYDSEKIYMLLHDFLIFFSLWQAARSGTDYLNPIMGWANSRLGSILYKLGLFWSANLRLGFSLYKVGLFLVSHFSWDKVLQGSWVKQEGIYKHDVFPGSLHLCKLLILIFISSASLDYL